MRKLVARRWWLALAGVAAAFGVATGVAVATKPQYRAELVVVVGHGNGPLRPGDVSRRLTESLAELLDSHLIAANIVENLRLRDDPDDLLDRITVSTPEPGLLRVRVRDDDRVRAEQIAQEIGLVFANLVDVRFGRRSGAAVPLRATVWDPAHPAGREGRGWGRNLGFAGIVAAFLCLAALVPTFLRTRTPDVARAAAPSPEAAAPAMDAEEAPVPAAEPEREEPTPEPVPAPVTGNAVLLAEAAPTANAATPATEWNLGVLEQLVDRHRQDYPERSEEWNWYLLYLREYANVDGRLPGTFDGLVLEAFGDLLGRGRG